MRGTEDNVHKKLFAPHAAAEELRRNHVQGSGCRKNDSCEINTAEPPREISKSNTVQIGTEELLIIGLLLLLLYGGGERDAVLLISMVLLAGFV